VDARDVREMTYAEYLAHERTSDPTVIVEVLSDITESDDRGDKWAHYQRIPSLREYVLVSQKSPRIEVFSRDAVQRDLWHYRDHGPGTHATVPSLEVSLSVDTIYASPLAR
jgi:Uma2 family endonuclease